MLISFSKDELEMLYLSVLKKALALGEIVEANEDYDGSDMLEFEDYTDLMIKLKKLNQNSRK